MPVPRKDPRDRLSGLAQAATVVFGRQGYRRTRTADIAAEAGMSSGSVFTYVESKEALFHLVFAYGFDALGNDLIELPIPTPAAGETVSLIAQNLRKVEMPRLIAALNRRDTDQPRTELQGIIEERYDMLGVLWPLLAVIERSAIDFPDLEDFYFHRARLRYHDRLAKYLGQRAKDGLLRRTPDAKLTARIVDESVTWFAWKRHEGRDARQFDDQLARNSVVDFVCAAVALEPDGDNRAER
jgi:AcrR family transcriptional regulator